MQTRECPHTGCKREKLCARECICKPCNCLRCRERTMKARDPGQHLFGRVQDHAASPARQEQVQRILNGTPVTELEPQQGSLF